MKLALARAILFEADILLLDEPTNHLDVLNVAWLENYLKSLTSCTSIIVSRAFLRLAFRSADPRDRRLWLPQQRYD